MVLASCLIYAWALPAHPRVRNCRSFGCVLLLNQIYLTTLCRSTIPFRFVHKFRHRSTRLCVGTHVFTKFSEITQYNGHYVVQGHSRSPILVPIESSLYNFLLVINANLPPILHRFRDIASERSKIATFFYYSLV